MLTTGEAANRMKVSKKTVRRWANEGKIDGYRTPGGREMRFKETDVNQAMRLIERRRRDSDESR